MLGTAPGPYEAPKKEWVGGGGSNNRQEKGSKHERSNFGTKQAGCGKGQLLSTPRTQVPTVSPSFICPIHLLRAGTTVLGPGDGAATERQTGLPGAHSPVKGKEWRAEEIGRDTSLSTRRG